MPDDQEISLPVSSSKPPVFCKQQESLFREVIQLLESNHVPFVISGAFALHEHTGIWRDTKDLDLFLPAQEVGRALRLLEKDGFATEVLDPVWLAKARRDGFFVDLITGMSNAVIRVDYSWIRHASRAEVFGMSVRVLAPEELIASKIFVTRRKFDWQRLLSLIGDHWEMLFWCLVLYHYVYPANSDYVPAEIWTEMAKRFSVELAHPNKGANFRGSLIDDKMFAIDVAEWGKRDILEEYRDKAEVIRQETEEA